MSIQLQGTYGFFTRSGAFIGAGNYQAALYGSAIVADFQAIWTQFATSDQAAVQNLPSQVAAYQQTGAGYFQTLGTTGQTAAQLQVNDDAPLVPYTFPQAIRVIAAQMRSGTPQSINRPTLTTTATAGGSNEGNTAFFASTTNIYGDPLDMTLTETFTCTCTSQGSGFNSSWSVVGQPAVPASAYNWPQGSGASTGVTAVDPANTGVVQNGAFTAFTVPNTPDNWTIINGSAGTTVFKGTGSGVRSGTDSCYLQSDGSSATQLAQAVSLQPNTVYAVMFQAKMNTGSASGSAVVELYDPNGAVVLANDAGTNLSQTYTLNGGGGQIGTSYAVFCVFFSTPRQLPSTVQLRIGYAVAGVSTRQLFLDLIQIVVPQPLYGLTGTGTAGPWVVSVSNTLPSAVRDTYTIAFTNSLTSKSFALGSERMFGLRESGVYYPSSVSPTISDSLVTH